MIPVEQTRFGRPIPNEPTTEPPGNCWAACIASILELPLDRVPDELSHWKLGMTPRESWRPYEQEMHRWLRQRHGLLLFTLRHGAGAYCGPKDCFEYYCIASGASPRSPHTLHAIVAKVAYSAGVTIAHDPHPDKTGLSGEQEKWEYEVFVKHWS